MSLSYLITKRFINSNKNSRLISTISAITISGIALGVCVVIIALTVLDGFENTVREKIINLNSHIKITAFGNKNLPNPKFVIPKLETKFQENLLSVQPFISKLAIIKSKNYTEGINIIGYDSTGIKDALGKYFLHKESKINGMNLGASPEPCSAASDGELHPTFLPAVAEREGGLTSNNTPEIFLGKRLSEKLMVTIGSTVTIFSLNKNQIPSFDNPPTIQQFYVAAIFESGMSEYDDLNAYIDFNIADGVFGMNGEISGYNLKLNDISKIETTSEHLQDLLGYPYYVRTIFKVHQNIFTWLELQKEPIPIILGLIIIVAVFNIIGTLLMVILERTNAVGILRSMGMNKKNILKIFLMHGFYLTILGIVSGNILALVLSLIQDKFEIISLPSSVYFLSKVPIYINAANYLLVTVITFIVSITASLLPALVATKIKPITAIRFD